MFPNRIPQSASAGGSQVHDPLATGSFPTHPRLLHALIENLIDGVLEDEPSKLTAVAFQAALKEFKRFWCDFGVIKDSH